MPQPLCNCTVLLKLAVVDWPVLQFENSWSMYYYLNIQARKDSDLPHLDSVNKFYTLTVVSANF